MLMKFKYEKEFREAHPETIGEKDSTFDLCNYTEWLETKVSRVELPVSDDFAENTFNQIEQYMGEKYRNWKLLKNKHYETIGYKRAYLDIKKLHKKICKQNSR